MLQRPIVQELLQPAFGFLRSNFTDMSHREIRKVAPQDLVSRQNRHESSVSKQLVERARAQKHKLPTPPSTTPVPFSMQPTKKRKTVDKRDVAWEAKCAHVQRHVQVLEKTGKPLAYPSKKNDRSLFDWLSQQRTNWKQGSMRNDRIAKLEGIGYVNLWKSKDDKNTGGGRRDDGLFRRLCSDVAQRQAQGDFNMPQRKDKLGKWVARQREKKKNGTLSNDRIASLDRVGFCWNMEQVHQAEAKWRRDKNTK